MAMRIPRLPAASVLLALLATVGSDPARTPEPSRPNTYEIPLQITGAGGRWGPDRNADHATVAINTRGDVPSSTTPHVSDSQALHTP